MYRQYYYEPLNEGLTDWIPFFGSGGSSGASSILGPWAKTAEGNQLLDRLSNVATKGDNAAIKGLLSHATETGLIDKNTSVTLANSFGKMSDTISKSAGASAASGGIFDTVKKFISDHSGALTTTALVGAGLLGAYYLYKKVKEKGSTNFQDLQNAARLNQMRG